MKHIAESLNEHYNYNKFNLLKESEESELKNQEKKGIDAIEKAKKNFEKFKDVTKGEIIRFKEFWEENQKNKKNFPEESSIYKFYDNDYCLGVFELPIETKADGTLVGGSGANEDEEEIIEGNEILNDEDKQNMVAETFNLINKLNEDAENMNLGLDDKKVDTEESEKEDLNDEDDIDLETPDIEIDEPSIEKTQKYFAIYDMSGGEREEIFRCGSNNVVNSFYSFYNDIFKGTMKRAIINYKEQKKEEKLKAERSEKKKIEKSKEDKLNKFLSESKRLFNKTN